LPSEVRHAQGWFRKGDSDQSAAERVVAGGGPFDTACFHAQQAVEKYLKAVLALTAVEIPRTHNLEELVLRVARSVPGLNSLLGEIVELTPYAVEMRYDFEFWPDAEAAGKALAVVGKVRQAVIMAWPDLESTS
jgi:HEPN domain-containing protein